MSLQFKCESRHVREYFWLLLIIIIIIIIIIIDLIYIAPFRVPKDT